MVKSVVQDYRSILSVVQHGVVSLRNCYLSITSA